MMDHLVRKIQCMVEEYWKVHYGHDALTQTQEFGWEGGMIASHMIDTSEKRFIEERVHVEMTNPILVHQPQIQKKGVVDYYHRWRASITSYIQELQYHLNLHPSSIMILTLVHVSIISGQKKLEPSMGDEFKRDLMMCCILCNGRVDDFLDVLNGYNPSWFRQVVDSQD